MQGGQSESAQARVRQALAQLGSDAESAPPVPEAVTTRIGAALRAEHAVSTRTRLSRRQIVAVIVGLIALAAAIGIGVAALSRPGAPPEFPSGPTADQITRSVSGGIGDTPKPVVTHP
jgi:hypothetical protein